MGLRIPALLVAVLALFAAGTAVYAGDTAWAVLLGFGSGACFWAASQGD